MKYLCDESMCVLFVDDFLRLSASDLLDPYPMHCAKKILARTSVSKISICYTHPCWYIVYSRFDDLLVSLRAKHISL